MNTDPRAPHILIADDDDGTRRTLTLILERNGYQVSSASSGQDALETARHQPIDLALLDLRLPDMEGVELLKPLRSLHPDIAMVLATGYASVETAMRAVNEGVDVYVTKPLDMDSVLGKVQDLLERQRLRRDNQRLYALAQQELTERRQAEEALRAALEQANEARSALLGVIEDQKQTEAALWAERALLRTLVDHLPVAVYLKDVAGRKTLSNPFDINYIGAASEAEVLGKTDLDLYPPDLAAEFYADDMAVIRSGEPILNREEEMLLPDGSRGWQLTSKVPMRDTSGEIVGLVGIGQDITERKESEKRLRRHEQLAAIGQLAAGIAHDFRNLLTTIILYAQLAQSRLDPTPAAIRYLDGIAGEARKATDLVQQILDFGRRTEIESRPLDLAELVASVITILARTLPEHIHIASEVAPGTLIIMGDAGRLQQALTNLALNARDAMPEGGTLHIRLARITMAPGEAPPLPEMVGAPTPPAWIRLTVADTGTGMSEEAYQHLFEPFFTTKEAGKGTGLGLAQVYGIVQLHGGHIDVRNVVGEGVTFHLYLPAVDISTEDTAMATRTAPPGHGEKLLLVEDNVQLREAGEAILAGLGYQVLTAANGREALDVYRDRQHIDLLITDLVMPEMGGKALMEALRRDTPQLKALAITGYTEEREEALLSAGFMAVIRKPFDASSLAQAVREALDQPTVQG